MTVSPEAHADRLQRIRAIVAEIDAVADPYAAVELLLEMRRATEALLGAAVQGAVIVDTDRMSQLLADPAAVAVLRGAWWSWMRDRAADPDGILDVAIARAIAGRLGLADRFAAEVEAEAVAWWDRPLRDAADPDWCDHCHDASAVCRGQLNNWSDADAPILATWECIRCGHQWCTPVKE